MRLPAPTSRLKVAAALAVACALAVAVALGVAGDDGGTGDGQATAPVPRTDGAGRDRGSATARGARDQDAGDAERPTAPGERSTPAERDERRVERTVREYVAALNERDGERVCRLFEPGALDGVELPRAGGDCGASLTASIGYRDPRGFPQWDEATLEHFASTEVEADDAQVTATIVSRFADRDEPSVEDDVIYLARRGRDWRIAQPSAILYRAIGAPEIPLELLTPPQG